MNIVATMGRWLGHGPTSCEPSRAVPSKVPVPAGARETPAAVREAAGASEPDRSARAAESAPPCLRPQEIVLDVDVPNRGRAIEVAAQYIGRAHGLDAAPIARALWRREQVGSTALGQGIAIPHARIAGIQRPLTLFMRSRYAIEFDAPDGKPVSHFLVIMVPQDGATDDHLQLLARAAEAFADRGFRATLAASTTALQVDRAFADWSARCMA